MNRNDEIFSHQVSTVDVVDAMQGALVMAWPVRATTTRAADSSAEVMTLADLCAELRQGSTKVRQLVRSGEIKRMKHFRDIRVSRKEFERFMERSSE